MGREERGVPLCLVWWSEAGQQMDPFGMGLPGNRWASKVPGGWLCSPPLTNGSARLCPEGGAEPAVARVAPFWGSLPALGQGVAQVTSRRKVTGPS